MVKQTDYEKALNSIPAAALNGIDLLSMRSVAELVIYMEIELDLIAEGQDGTEEYTRRDVRAMKSWVKKWKGKS